MSNTDPHSQSETPAASSTLTDDQIIDVRRVYTDRRPAIEFDEFLSRTVTKFEPLQEFTTAAAAAVLVADETEPIPTEIAAVSPDQERATVRGIVTSLSDIIEFSTENSTGRVLNVEVVDADDEAHGHANLSFWHDTADTALSQLSRGDVITATGEPSEPFHDTHTVDIAVSEGEWTAQSDTDESDQLTTSSDDLLSAIGTQQRVESVTGRLLYADPVELSATDEANDTQQLHLAFFLGTESGSCRVIARGEPAQALCAVDPGTSLALTHLSVSDSYGEPYLSTTSDTTWTISPASESPEYQPTVTPLADLTSHSADDATALPNSVTVAGSLTLEDSVQPYESSSGSGSLRNGALTDSTQSCDIVCWDARAHTVPLPSSGSDSYTALLLGATPDWNDYTETIELHVNDDSAVIPLSEPFLPDSLPTVPPAESRRSEHTSGEQSQSQTHSQSHETGTESTQSGAAQTAASPPSHSSAETDAAEAGTDATGSKRDQPRPSTDSQPHSDSSHSQSSQSAGDTHARQTSPEYDAEYTGRIFSAPTTRDRTVQLDTGTTRHQFTLGPELSPESLSLGAQVTLRIQQTPDESSSDSVVEIL